MPRIPVACLSLALVGCTTSAQDVMFEPVGSASEAISLSVAWADMEARMNTLQAELAKTRSELDSLCELPGAAARDVCRRIGSLESSSEAEAAELAALSPAVDLLAEQLEETQALLSPIAYDARSRTWVLTGVNLQVRNGTGATEGEGDGTGNIIVGWNEASDDDARTGSHNLVVGAGHGWESHSGVISGTDHLVLGPGGAALGGEGNTVTAEGAVAVGGQDNTSAGLLGVTVGGSDNVVEGELAMAAGGSGNDALGAFTVALGGINGRVDTEGWVILGPVHGPDLPREVSTLE